LLVLKNELNQPIPDDHCLVMFQRTAVFLRNGHPALQEYLSDNLISGELGLRVRAALWHRTTKAAFRNREANPE
jgi:hypothetical protein